jgi:hypothetical protein
VAREIIAEPLINTFVEQNTHLGTGEQEFLRFFEGSDGCCTRDCGKTLQEIFERLSALQAIEKGLDGHSRPAKNRGSAENVRIFDDHVHDLIVSRADGRPVRHRAQYSLNRMLRLVASR